MNKFETLWSNDFGRYLVADRDIPAKTPIFLEDALLHAPADNVRDKLKDERTMICLVCCRPCEEIERRCSSCDWCVCSVDCEKMSCHTDECNLFTKYKVTFPPPNGWPILNKTILVLRCLFTKIRDPRAWTDFLGKLEHHSKARSKKVACIKGDDMIVENIKYFYRLGECPFTDQEIRFVCGVINVNAFYAETIDKFTGVPWRAKCLFEKASLFAHSCSPNCSWTIRFSKNGETSQGQLPNIQIEVVTAVPIRKGEMLTIFYSTRYSMYGTLKRIVFMEEIAHFLCKCTRCNDRTEMGTFMSAIKCLDCETNYMLPEEPTNIHSRWKCFNTFCGSTTTVNKIVYKVYQIEEFVEKIRSSNLSVQEELKLLQEVIGKYSGIFLHRNHYALQDISMRILQLLVEGEEGILNENKISEINQPFLELFLTHCKYLLEIAHILLPAMTGHIDTLETYLQEAERIKRSITEI